MKDIIYLHKNDNEFLKNENTMSINRNYYYNNVQL